MQIHQKKGLTRLVLIQGLSGFDTGGKFENLEI